MKQYQYTPNGKYKILWNEKEKEKEKQEEFKETIVNRTIARGKNGNEKRLSNKKHQDGMKARGTNLDQHHEQRYATIKKLLYQNSQ